MSISTKLQSLAAIIAFAILPAQTSLAGKPLPFEMPEIPLPEIPDYRITLTEFDAHGDGMHDNTAAFRNAMTHLKEHGGGHLDVPAGVWRTGPISLESNVNLHLHHGALILFSDNRDDYPLFRWDVPGNAARECISPISAFDKHDISITGHGAINGSGEAWRPVKKAKLTESQWNKLCNRGVLADDGKTWFPSADIRDYNHDRIGAIDCDDDSAWHEARHFMRPVMVQPVRCRRVLLQGVTFDNSPRWNIRPLLCTDIVLRDITVRNPYYAQNGDGLDIESCSNVLVSGCTFDVGDDAICIKSGRDEEGRRRNVPTSKVLIENCTVYHGHGGFVIGSEMSGGVHDITVRNCTFIGTDAGIKFKSVRGRGGKVNNIYIDGIQMHDIIGDAITIDLYYGQKKPGQAEPVTEATPIFENVNINNVTCSGASRAIWLNGLPEMPLYGFTISNSNITADKGAEIRNATKITLDKVVIRNDSGPAVSLDKVSGFKEL